MPIHTLTRAETHERRGRIVEMRRQGVPWDEIATAFDITPQRAHQLYNDALQAFPKSQVAEHRHEETELVDYAVNRLKAIIDADGEDPATGKRVSARTRIEALSALRGWSEHRSRLYGLLAPTKSQVDVVTHDSLSAEMERLAAELGEQDAGGATRDMVDAALTSATADQDA